VHWRPKLYDRRAGSRSLTASGVVVEKCGSFCGLLTTKTIWHFDRHRQEYFSHWIDKPAEQQIVVMLFYQLPFRYTV
jgi:hypothetical protein